MIFMLQQPPVPDDGDTGIDTSPSSGPPVPGNGDTDIDNLIIDNYLIYGVIIAIVIGFIAINKLHKSYSKI